MPSRRIAGSNSTTDSRTGTRPEATRIAARADVDQGEPAFVNVRWTGVLDLTRIALVVTGGIGGVVALVVAYRRQRLHEQADHRETGKLFTERFIAASAQLGHDSAAVRLAGAYAMAELADDSPAHLHTCVDVLCAYLRLPYTPTRDGDGWKPRRTGGPPVDHPPHW